MPLMEVKFDTPWLIIAMRLVANGYYLQWNPSFFMRWHWRQSSEILKDMEF